MSRNIISFPINIISLRPTVFSVTFTYAYGGVRDRLRIRVKIRVRVRVRIKVWRRSILTFIAIHRLRNWSF